MSLPKDPPPNWGKEGLNMFDSVLVALDERQLL